VPEEPVAAGQRRLSYARSPVPAHEDLQLVPLPVGVALQLLAGNPRPVPDGLRPVPDGLRPEPDVLLPDPEDLGPEPEDLGPEPVEGRLITWHAEYPQPDSVDAVAMVVAAHRAVTGEFDKPPAWWIHHIVVNGVVVGDIGFHGPAAADGAVEIGYTVVPAWRGRGVASRACGLIVERAWQDGAEIVIAETENGNVASQIVLLRNGFQRRSDGIFMIRRPEARWIA
jgi:RimJ/RimL family protein N-acetyltransferase